MTYLSKKQQQVLAMSNDICLHFNCITVR